MAWAAAVVASAVVVLTAVLLVPAVDANMNEGGVPYTISNPSGQGSFSTEFTDEYFDVYGEVQTRYSQVYWTRNDPYDLPPAIVARFNGKVMAITGYEIDQVMKDANGNDVPIPIYNQYNHHYFAWLVNANAAEVYTLDKPVLNPHPTWTGIRPKAGVRQTDYPSNIVFKENPGGEFRKSYHGYPNGFAQLIESPTTWLVEPMQIDTHNRANGTNATVPTGFAPWFLPAMMEGQYNTSWGLSPLITCPCTDRITRIVINASTILVQGTCEAPITTVTACAVAVAALAPLATAVTVADPARPAGCIMTPSATGNGSYVAVFNTASSAATCDDGSQQILPFTWSAPQTNAALDCVGGTCLPSNASYGCTGEFAGQCTWDSAEAALTGCGQYPECQGFFCSDFFAPPGKAATFLCYGRDTFSLRAGYAPSDTTWLKARSIALAGAAVTNLVNLNVSIVNASVTLTLSGPDGSWFGVGFDAGTMADAPYALIVDGAGLVTERRLVNHGPGTLLAPSVAVISSAAVAGVRTVQVTRPAAGATAEHYTFATTPGAINLIMAIGDTPAIAYHKARSGATISLIPTEVDACLCAPKSTTYLSYMNSSTTEYSVVCQPEPRGDMLAQNNPACNMETYMGGLHCCYHEWFLTDVAQEALIPAAVDTYYLKFRYYFQEYTPAAPPTAPASHQHLHHWVFLIDADVNDYTEVACAPGTVKCVANITAHLTARNMGLEDTPATYSGITPLVITPHCHAPSCLRQELYNADTGALICGVTIEYGHSTDTFNELSYIAVPPCLFGNQSGLLPPITISPDTNLYAIKYFDNSFRQLGQMAQWTGLMIYEP